jgi:hypothetical protein
VSGSRHVVIAISPNPCPHLQMVVWIVFDPKVRPMVEGMGRAGYSPEHTMLEIETAIKQAKDVFPR